VCYRREGRSYSDDFTQLLDDRSPGIGCRSVRSNRSEGVVGKAQVVARRGRAEGSESRDIEALPMRCHRRVVPEELLEGGGFWTAATEAPVRTPWPQSASDVADMQGRSRYAVEPIRVSPPREQRAVLDGGPKRNERRPTFRAERRVLGPQSTVPPLTSPTFTTFTEENGELADFSVDGFSRSPRSTSRTRRWHPSSLS